MIPQPALIARSPTECRPPVFIRSGTGRKRLSIGAIFTGGWAKKRRLHFKVKGQRGVDFLSMICDQAYVLKVTGYCQDCPDGTIRGEAQGDESQLNDFVTYLRKGPVAADLVGADIDEVRPKYGEKGYYTIPDGCDSPVYRTPTVSSGTSISRRSLSWQSNSSSSKTAFQPATAVGYGAMFMGSWS